MTNFQTLLFVTILVVGFVIEYMASREAKRA